MYQSSIKPLKIQLQKQTSQQINDASERSHSKSKSPARVDYGATDTSVLELISEIDDTLKRERRPEPEDLSILKDLSIVMRKNQHQQNKAYSQRYQLQNQHYNANVVTNRQNGEEQESLQIVPSVNTGHQNHRVKKDHYGELVGEAKNLGSCVPSVK